MPREEIVCEYRPFLPASSADSLAIDHEWKNNFFIQCLTPMLEVVAAVNPPDYTRVVQLDKSARNFGIPSILEEPKPREGQTRFSIMQKGLVLMSREIGASVSRNVECMSKFFFSVAPTASKIFHRSSKRARAIRP